MLLPQGLTTFHRLIVPTLEAGEAQPTPCRRALFRQLYAAFLALDRQLASIETVWLVVADQQLILQQNHL